MKRRVMRNMVWERMGGGEKEMRNGREMRKRQEEGENWKIGKDPSLSSGINLPFTYHYREQESILFRSKLLLIRHNHKTVC